MGQPVSIEAIPEPMLAPGYSKANSSKSKPRISPVRSERAHSAEELDYTFAAERAIPHDPDFARDPEIAGGKILSITDRKLDEAETDHAGVAETTAPADGDGWTARAISNRSP
jgi:hypothetical protein